MLSPPEDLVKAITLGNEDLQGNIPKRIPLRVEGGINIDLGSIIKVSVMMVSAMVNRKYLVTVLRHEEGSTGTVLSGKEAQELEVSNLGRQPMTWKVGYVTARAKQCKSRNNIQVRKCSIDEGDLNFFQADVGDIDPGEMAQLIELLKSMEVCFSKSKTG